MAQQGKIILLSIVLYFFIRSSLIGSQDVEGESFIQVAFHKLEGNSLQTITVRSLLHCGMRCERVPECLSFNIAVVPTNNGLYECVLLKNDTSESSDYLVPSQEYHHYTRFVDPCSVPRCKNGGTCQTIGNDFRCHCPQGLTGKLCGTGINSTALGIECGTIPDSSINASSYYDPRYLPHYARLYSPKAWASKDLNTNQWLQVDLGTVAIVTGIATQGNGLIAKEWVKTYSLQYGLNSSYLEDYEGGKNLTGNKDDKNTVVMNALQPAITARYIRVIPKSWNNHITLRMELYGFKQGKGINCTPLGMESGAIPDSSINASSYFDVRYKPKYARLHGTQAWASKDLDTNQWLQVDLGTVTFVRVIATQGNGLSAQEWVKTYSLQYGLNSSYFEDYEGGNILTGNNDKNTVVKNALQPAITARYIRVLPKSWNIHITLRMELYGCKQENEE